MNDPLMPVKLTIDGREVEVEAGTTILAAAKQLGIEIPTLCHRDGIEPFGSCFLCVVQVEGRSNLTPACVAPAAQGMVVTTQSDDVRSARKTALELLLSDHCGDCVAPCTVACPAGLDIPGFIRQLLAGQPTQALALIKERIALPGALGRICPRYCERVCRRRELDEPIAICALKRFAADRELGGDDLYVPPRSAATGKRVAIVGAGPAGLAAAYYLLQHGHACTLFDAHAEPGGLFRHAIPEFMLPRAALDREIEPIRRLGAEFRTNVRLGQDVSLDRLRSDHDAVLLALGAQSCDSVAWEGADRALSALDFLREAAAGPRPNVGEDAVVVGGGHEAVDAARTAVRLGAKNVTVVWEKDRQHMPCPEEHAAAAEAEGVKIQPLTRPVRLEQVDELRLRLICNRDGEDLSLDASCVIAAPVRRVDTAQAERMGLKVSRKGIAADPKTLATSLDGVFAAGEAASGPTSGVRAVAAGRLASVAIHQYLSGQPVIGERRMLNVHMGKLSETEKANFFRDHPQCPRVQQGLLAPEERRSGFEEVEMGLSDAQAAEEAGRCMQCDCIARDDCKLRLYATEYGAQAGRFKGERRLFERDATHPEIVYEPGKCIACGLCARIAAEGQENIGMSFAQRGFAARMSVPFGRAVADALTHAATRCVEACPTGALAFKRCDCK